MLIAIVIVLRMVPKKLAVYWVSVGIKIGDLLFFYFLAWLKIGAHLFVSHLHLPTPTCGPTVHLTLIYHTQIGQIQCDTWWVNHHILWLH